MEDSRLSQIAGTERDFHNSKKEYQRETNEYSVDHENAKSDGDVKGKGNGMAIGYVTPNVGDFSVSENGIRTQRMNYSNFPTRESGSMTIGGEYDRNGNSNIPKSGRFNLMGINTYSENNEYGEGSVMIDGTIPGQFFIR